MIELKLTGCCKNCKHSDLELRSYSIFFDLETDARYRVTCKHENVRCPGQREGGNEA